MFEFLLVNILTTMGVLLCFGFLLFLLAQYINDNSVMDIAYGPLFTLTAITMPLVTGNTSPYGSIVTLLIGIWSLRLGVRIFRKNFGKPEDARYANWRIKWNLRGRRYFLLRSFLQINVLQCLIIAIVLLPFTVAYSTTHPHDVIFHLTFIQLLGISIFCIGLLYETIADMQLDRFLARKQAGTETAILMTTGLFRYSRRPNYFGESLLWWGLALVALPLPYGWLALASPLLITYIVTQVTGPMLENIFIEKLKA